MAIAMRGLKLKPTYGSLIGVAFPCGLENLKFPNRSAKFLRDGHTLSQLGGEGVRAMEQQQQRHMKEVYIDSALKPLASNLDNESISNSSFNNVYTRDLQTQNSRNANTSQ